MMYSTMTFMTVTISGSQRSPVVAAFLKFFSQFWTAVYLLDVFCILLHYVSSF